MFRRAKSLSSWGLILILGLVAGCSRGSQVGSAASSPPTTRAAAQDAVDNIVEAIGQPVAGIGVVATRSFPVALLFPAPSPDEVVAETMWTTAASSADVTSQTVGREIAGLRGGGNPVVQHIAEMTVEQVSYVPTQPASGLPVGVIPPRATVSWTTAQRNTWILVRAVSAWTPTRAKDVGQIPEGVDSARIDINRSDSLKNVSRTLTGEGLDSLIALVDVLPRAPTRVDHGCNPNDPGLLRLNFFVGSRKVADAVISATADSPGCDLIELHVTGARQLLLEGGYQVNGLLVQVFQLPQAYTTYNP